MEMEDNEIDTEEFSEESDVFNQENAGIGILAMLIAKFEKWINNFSYFQKHPKQSKCVVYTLIMTIGVCFLFGYILIGVAKAASDQRD